MNLPIYRAKKIDSDEYVVGFYVDTVDFLTKTLKNKNGYITKNGSFHIIDISTLSIHIPDMIDSQGNKIFASLDRYYLKGADILENDSFLGDYNIQVAIYSEGCFYVQDKDGEMYNLCENWEKLKVIGIHE